MEKIMGHPGGEAGADAATPEEALPLLRLPDWNDLTNDQRRMFCEKAEFFHCDECWPLAGQSALEMYELVRASVTLRLPPLIEGFHLPSDGVGHGTTSGSDAGSSVPGGQLSKATGHD